MIALFLLASKSIGLQAKNKSIFTHLFKMRIIRTWLSQKNLVKQKINMY